jgi:hypothetical protein
MAIDILSIPSMSAEPERFFSGAKITVRERRNRLTAGTIEAIECLKSSLRVETFDLVDTQERDDVVWSQGEKG